MTTFRTTTDMALDLVAGALSRRQHHALVNPVVGVPTPTTGYAVAVRGTTVDVEGEDIVGAVEAWVATEARRASAEHRLLASWRWGRTLHLDVVEPTQSVRRTTDAVVNDVTVYQLSVGVIAATSTARHAA